VSAVAQVMLDPHYRTIEGFITLIQKDFLSFGHKFRDRNGIEGCEDWFEIENERIQPSKRHVSSAESNNLSTISSKALSGAKSWFEKGRGNLFKQQNASRDNVSETSSSRPASPPPNEFLHSPPSKSEKKPHKMEENEVSPIFHQFLDAVYQLMYQRPLEFEYNERFLRRLFYHVYAGQYGDFLFNTERKRSQYQDRLPSAWGHFLARKEEFTSPEYKSGGKDTLILPKRSEAGGVPDVRWWSALFGRTDEEMNVPKALAIEPPRLEVQPSAVSYDEGPSKPSAGLAVENIRATKSTPNLTAIAAGSAEVGEGGEGAQHGATPSTSAIEIAPRPPLLSKETDFEILEKYTGSSEASSLPTHSSEPVLVKSEDASDPLGVSDAPRQMETRRMDFAAFAQDAAFSER
ncbi:phosphatidylinositol-3-phosphatase ymr1, partial [Oleoguttula sp. CCFEE 5521]